MVEVSESTTRVEPFTRAGAVGTYDRVAEAIKRVRDLEAENRVAECRVVTWDKQVVLGNGHLDQGRAVLETVSGFESWAGERGVSLYPFFEERTRSSLATDDEQTVMVLAVFCLAVYNGERLCKLFPCAVGEMIDTVHDGLAALERNESGPTPFDGFAES